MPPEENGHADRDDDVERVRSRRRQALAESGKEHDLKRVGDDGQDPGGPGSAHPKSIPENTGAALAVPAGQV